MLAFVGRKVQSICQPSGAASRSLPRPKTPTRKARLSVDSNDSRLGQQRDEYEAAATAKSGVHKPSTRSLKWQIFLWILTILFSFLCWRVLQHCAQHFPLAVRGELWTFPWLFWFWSWYLGAIKSTEIARSGLDRQSSTVSADSTASPRRCSRYDAQRAAVVEELTYGGERDVDSYVKMLDQRLLAQKPPSDPEALLASGWQDHSKNRIQIFLSAQDRIRDEPFPRVGIYIKAKTQDHAKSFPLTLVDEGCGCRYLRGGGLVIYYCMKYWPLWFPFSQKVKLLKQISKFQQVWLHQLKVLWFTVDNIFLFTLQDKLGTDGCIEVLMRSPPEGMEGRTWLGVVLPKSEARARVQVASMRLAGYPTSMDHCDFEFQCEVYDPFKGGVNWIVVMFWQTIASKIIPMILKMQAKFDGSDMDKYFNDGTDKHGKQTKEGFIDLHSHIQKFLGDKAA